MSVPTTAQKSAFGRLQAVMDTPDVEVIVGKEYYQMMLALADTAARIATAFDGSIIEYQAEALVAALPAPATAPAAVVAPAPVDPDEAAFLAAVDDEPPMADDEPPAEPVSASVPTSASASAPVPAASAPAPAAPAEPIRYDDLRAALVSRAKVTAATAGAPNPMMAWTTDAPAVPAPVTEQPPAVDPAEAAFLASLGEPMTTTTTAPTLAAVVAPVLTSTNPFPTPAVDPAMQRFQASVAAHIAATPTLAPAASSAPAEEMITINLGKSQQRSMTRTEFDTYVAEQLANNASLTAPQRQLLSGSAMAAKKLIVAQLLGSQTRTPQQRQRPGKPMASPDAIGKAETARLTAVNWFILLGDPDATEKLETIHSVLTDGLTAEEATRKLSLLNIELSGEVTEAKLGALRRLLDEFHATRKALYPDSYRR